MCFKLWETVGMLVDAESRDSSGLQDSDGSCFGIFMRGKVQTAAR